MKKGQLGSSVYFVIFIMMLILCWVYLVWPVIQDTIPGMISSNGITGIEAFLWNNLNLFFFITLFIIVLSYAAIMRGKKRYGGI